MNIVFLGDSITKGVIYDEEKARYVVSKNSFVKMLSKNSNLNITSLAKFGATVDKGIEIFRAKAGSLMQDAYVFILFGGNDCDLSWTKISEDPGSIHLAKTPMGQFEIKFDKLISDIMTFGLKPVIITLPPLSSERFFYWVSRGLNKENILEFLGGDVNFISKWHEGYNHKIKEVARRKNLPLVDIRKALSKYPPSDLTCIDGMHPNEFCHGLIVKSIEDFITNENLKATS